MFLSFNGGSLPVDMETVFLTSASLIKYEKGANK